MKKILTVLLLFISYCVSAQTFDPTKGTVSNKPYSPAQAVPTDARSYFYDGVNFLWRPYSSTTEVKTYLNLAKYRAGNFIIVVDSGGVLNSNGTYTGGVNTFWMFKDGTLDANLVELNLTGGTGGGTGTLTNLTSTPGGGITLGISNPTTIPNITPSVTLGGDISGSSLSAVTVTKFNGQLPSFYLNYNNLSNTPTIPAQFNPIAGTGITLSGTYPNITFNSAASGFNTAGVFLVGSGGGSTINLDTLHYRKMDSAWMINDSVMVYTINGSHDTLSIRGGVGGGGGGSGTVISVSGTNANGVSFSITNPTSTPNITITLGAITPTTVNGLTLATISNGFTITGGTGTPRTLTVNAGNANVSGTNTGDVTLAGEAYLSLTGQLITANPINVSGTNITGILKAASFPALTGDVTTSAGALATTISNGAVTYAKIQNVTSQTILGRYAGTNGVVQEITLGSGLTLNTSTGVLNTTGVGSVTSVAVASTDLSVSGSPITSSGTITLNVNNNAITYAKFQQVAASSLVGNPTGSLANAQAIGIGYGLRFSGTTLLLDTANIKDTIFIKPVGASGLTTVYISTVIPDTIYNKRLIAGANVTLTQNSDSSITIAASGGGSGGITTVGAFDSQVPSTDGAVISGSSIYFQSASSTKAGMLNTVSQTIAGAKTFSSAPIFSTLTTNGGVFWGNASGTLLQSNSGSATQVLHGGTYPASPPSFSAVVLTTDVSGILPLANGGNGTPTPSIAGGTGISVTGTWGAYTITATTLGTVTSVNGSGGTTGLTVTGGPITSSGTLTLGGTLVPANGGTGLSSLTPYAVLAGGSTSTGTLQQVSGVGTTGQVLTSNGPGQLPSWQAVSASGSVNLDVAQTYTSGATVTVSNGTNVLYVDPASLTAALTVTLPATPHNSNTMYILFGGTITGGNAVITSLTVAGNTGQTLDQASAPTTGFSGNSIVYKWRSGTSTWYRVN